MSLDPWNWILSQLDLNWLGRSTMLGLEVTGPNPVNSALDSTSIWVKSLGSGG